MLYYNVPIIYYIFKLNDFKLTIDDRPIFISNTICKKLYTHKEKIDNLNDRWDIVKKYVNPYEYIHTIIPGIYKSVSKYKPISRAFFKFIEINKQFNLLNYSGPIKTFHLAEGPGGFIEAISKLRDNEDDIYYGITLIHDKKAPGWGFCNKLLNRYKNIYIEYGATNTGNILLAENYKHCYDKYKSSMAIITGDGGFDFSSDYNQQENNSRKLIFVEILYIISLQKKEGSSIIKIYDSFSQFTVEAIFLLSSFYKKCNIVKLNTSRVANSEKYIICKGFRYENIDSYYPIFYNMIKELESHDTLSSFLTVHIPLYLLSTIEEINNLLGALQINYILKIIHAIQFRHMNPNKTNIQKCIAWCIKHDIDYNEVS